MSTNEAIRTFSRRKAFQFRRNYAVQAPGVPTLEVFNRRVKWMQKERAASSIRESRNVDYIRDEVAARLCERLQFIKRRFPKVLDLGANACNIGKSLTNPDTGEIQSDDDHLLSKISDLVAVDSSRKLLHRDQELPFNEMLQITRTVVDDEETIPYEAETFDAVISSLSLHWINDLPSLLSQVNNVLKPDGPFLAAMFGGDTLYELRTSLQLADLDRRGGVSTRMSPLADVRDIGGLLQKANFKMLTVDVDDIIVDFPTIFDLMTDLQAMGESNAVLGREPGAIQRDVLLASQGIYKELHGNPDGTLPATFRIIYMIGWKESPNQAKPLPRGSGDINLKDALESSS